MGPPVTVPDDETLHLTLVLRPTGSADEIDAALAHNEALLPGDSAARKDVAALLAVDDEALRQARAFIHEHGLTEEGPIEHGSHLRISGTVDAINQAFGVTLRRIAIDGRDHHYHDEDFSLPEEVYDHVVGVLGLDSLPVLHRPHVAAAPSSGAEYRSVPASRIAEHYGFPRGTGAGQRVAILCFGGGFLPADMEKFFGAGKVPEISEHRVGGAAPNPATTEVLNQYLTMWNDPSSSFVDTMERMGEDFGLAQATVEVTMDIQLVGALVPESAIHVYYANYTVQGLVDALKAALEVEPAAIAMSWASGEDYWVRQHGGAVEQTLQYVRAAGVTVCCASGDAGSRGYYSDEAADNLAHVMYPASSVHVLACGGTELSMDEEGAFTSERAWRDWEFHQAQVATGGGVSGWLDRPKFQEQVPVPDPSSLRGKVWVEPGKPQEWAGRGVPDVAASAAMQVAYHMVLAGQDTFGGGTSAAAPVWAAFAALLSESCGAHVGWLPAHVYAYASETMVPISSGDNSVSQNVVSFSAASGWDPCTGWGRPNGAGWVAKLRGNES